MSGTYAPSFSALHLRRPRVCRLRRRREAEQHREAHRDGDGDPDHRADTRGPQKLDPAYGTFVAATRLNSAKVCVQRLNGVETAKLHLALSRGTDNLIKLARQQPDALYEPGGDEDPITMRQVLSDLASDNEACNPQLTRKLDRAVDTLPAAP